MSTVENPDFVLGGVITTPTPALCQPFSDVTDGIDIEQYPGTTQVGFIFLFKGAYINGAAIMTTEVFFFDDDLARKHVDVVFDTCALDVTSITVWNTLTHLVTKFPISHMSFYFCDFEQPSSIEAIVKVLAGNKQDEGWSLDASVFGGHDIDTDTSKPIADQMKEVVCSDAFINFSYACPDDESTPMMPVPTTTDASLCSASQEFIDAANRIDVPKYVDAGAGRVGFSFHLNGTDFMTTRVTFCRDSTYCSSDYSYADHMASDFRDPNDYMAEFDIVTCVPDFSSDKFWDAMARFNVREFHDCFWDDASNCIRIKWMDFWFWDLGEDPKPGDVVSAKGSVMITGDWQVYYWRARGTEDGPGLPYFEETESVRELRQQFTETVCNEAFKDANLAYACPPAHLG